MAKEIGNLEKEVAQVVESLPPIPANMERLLNLPAGRQESREIFHQMAEEDSGLCTELLHMANSACFSGHEKAETIDDAIESVDVELMANLVGARFARNAVRSSFRELRNLPQYFNHSREISLSCSVLSEQTKMSPHDRDLCTVAGLIHDIGRLVIILAADERSAPLLGTSWDKMLSIVEDEKRIMRLNHCDLGQQICKKWHFSAFLQEGVLRHHTPLLDDDFSFPGALIFLAHFISLSDLTGDILSTILPPGALSDLNLSVKAVEKAREVYWERHSDWQRYSIWE